MLGWTSREVSDGNRVTRKSRDPAFVRGSIDAVTTVPGHTPEIEVTSPTNATESGDGGPSLVAEDPHLDAVRPLSQAYEGRWSVAHQIDDTDSRAPTCRWRECSGAVEDFFTLAAVNTTHVLFGKELRW
jgi:hypothetical protein